MMENDAKRLIENVKNGNFESVKKILDDNPHVQFAFTEEKESIVTIAIKSKQIDIYKLLITRGWQHGSEENLNKMVKKYFKDFKVRDDLLDFHLKQSISSSLNHLVTLAVKSNLAHTNSSSEKQKLRLMVIKIFEHLNEIKWIEPILKVVANAEKLTLVFDIDSESIAHLDPTGPRHTNGVTHANKGAIVIAVKGLEDPDKQFEVLGVVAHELCHYAMSLVYNNGCNPYFKHEEPHRKFEEISEYCEKHQFVEPNISSVFCYDEDKQHGELIARVPHLLALYTNIAKPKLEELKLTFKELFQFYENETYVDLNKEIPLMEARRSVRELNELSRLLAHLESSKLSLKSETVDFEFNIEKTSVIRSNCPELSMQSIYKKLSSQDRFKSSYVFIKIKTLKNDNIFQLTAKVHSSCTKPTLIIDCTDEKLESIKEIAERLREGEVKERIVFVQAIGSYEHLDCQFISFKHSWSDLSNETQMNLHKQIVSFQNHKIELKNLIKFESAALETIPLEKLLNENLKVGKDFVFKSKSENHVERKFLPPNAKNASLELSSDNLMLHAEAHQTVLLSDSPGSGKTTEFQMFAMKLKSLHISRWVVHLDLKDFVAAFQRDEKVAPEDFKTSKQIIEYFCTEILKISGFDAKVFRDLYKENRVVFLMDGFDEISPSYKKFNLKLIRGIREKSGNQLWISTRPHLQKELKVALNSSVHKIKPFSKDNRKAFLKLFVKSEQSLSDKFDEIEDFLNRLQQNSGSDPVANPLVLEIIGKLVKNKPDTKFEEGNLYSLYKQFVNSLFTNFVLKGGEAGRGAATLLTERTDVMEFHQQKACLAVFDFESEDEEVKNCAKDCFKTKTFYDPEEMARVGLVTYEAFQVKFMHRTFAEYLVANVISQKLFEAVAVPSRIMKILSMFFFWDTQNISFCSLLRHVWLNTDSRQYHTLRNFIEGAITEKTKTSNNNFRLNFRKVFYFNDLQTIFLQSFEDGLINMVELVLESGLTNKKVVEDLFRSKDDNGKTAVILAIENQSPEFVERVLLAAGKHLDTKTYRMLFFDKSDDNENCFHSAVLNVCRAEMLEFLLKSPLNPLTEVEKLEQLTTCGPSGRNVLVYAVKNLNFSVFKTVLDALEKIYGRNILKIMLESLDKRQNTILVHASESINNEVDFTFFCKCLKDKIGSEAFVKMFINIDKFNRTSLMKALGSCNSQKFTVFWKLFDEVLDVDVTRRNYLLHRDNLNRMAIHYAILNEDVKIFHLVREAYEETFGLDKMKQLILIKNSDQENILFEVTKCEALRCVRNFWSFAQTLFDIETLKDFLLEENKFGYSFVEGINDKATFNDKLMIFNSFVVANFTDDELQHYEKRVARHRLFSCQFLKLEINHSMMINSTSVVPPIHHPVSEPIIPSLLQIGFSK